MDMDNKDEYRKQRKAERERKRKEAREAAEKKKRFGLTPEKKKRLRALIRQKASEDLQVEATAKAHKKKTYLADKIQPLPTNLESLSESELQHLLNSLHDKINNGESERYDIEFKVRRNDYEINELTVKVNDIKGKFIKPTLNKVSQIEGQMNKSRKKENYQDFRENLKSTGINKYSLETNAIPADGDE
ncbi:hypothetical protein GJ496_007111 [Pomphorhynchus laevis]|nr:hypothetical protein GJ496_007111 [Pomphorhynchus laevis]